MTALHQDLQEIAADAVRMLSLLREECELARAGLISADTSSASACIAADERVDRMQEELERRILIVIARRQPAARDLRFLGAMHRALADIERAGDYAVHVARSALALAGHPPIKRYTDIERIFEILLAMLEVSVRALTEPNAEAARKVLEMDNEIDDLYEQIQRELLSHMIEDASKINVAIQLLAVGRYLERLGDHLENVNEHVIFWLTNERL